MKDIQNLFIKFWMLENIGRKDNMLDDKLFIKNYINSL